MAIDARGHGDSDWAADGVYGQDAMVADLPAWSSSSAGERPVLVGASMGGGTSLVAVGEDRVDATALVLVDIAPRIEPEGVGKIQAFMNQKPEGFDSLEEVADAIASYQPHREPPKPLAGLAKNVRLGADGRYHWHWDPRFRNGSRDLGVRERRLEACAQRLSLPTLLVRGGLSDVLTEEGAQAFLRPLSRTPSTSTSPGPRTWSPATATTFSAMRSSTSWRARFRSPAIRCNRRIRCSHAAKGLRGMSTMCPEAGRR